MISPHSIEAEESIISAILIDSVNTLVDVAALLTPDDFYKTQHQAIFSAIIRLMQQNHPVDLVSVSDELRNSGDIQSMGASYLAYLCDSCPVAGNHRHTAKIIKDRAIMRRLIESSDAIARRCRCNDFADISEAIDYAEKSIFNIATERTADSNIFAADDIVLSCIESLELRQRNRSSVTGVRSGFKNIDTLTAGFQNSDLIILAARTSMGKTALALNIARNAVEDSKPVLIFSLEMSKEQLTMRLIGSEARVDSYRMRTGNISSADWKRINTAAAAISATPIFIDDTADITATAIRTKARRLKIDKGLGLIIIDYIQLMRSSSKAERRDLEIGEISRSLKILAKDLNVPVIALSQLNRGLEQRADKRPILSDLRESGSLEQDADLVMFIYRDEVYNKDENNPNRGTAEIILAKQRNGPIGRVYLTFLGSYTKFEDTIN